MQSRIPKLLPSLSLLLLTLAVAGAQPADDFFHGGAQFYLSNNIPAAKESVTNGLKLYPDDVKLKKLYELLNQQQQQQQQNQQDQKEQKQDQQKQDEKKDQQSKDDQKKKDEQKSKDQADKKDQEKKQDQEQSKSSDDKSKEKPDDKQQVAAHAMTPQEAKQLLDAQKGEEKVLQFAPQGEPKRGDRKLKDW